MILRGGRRKPAEEKSEKKSVGGGTATDCANGIRARCWPLIGRGGDWPGLPIGGRDFTALCSSQSVGVYYYSADSMDEYYEQYYGQ